MCTVLVPFNFDCRVEFVVEIIIIRKRSAYLKGFTNRTIRDSRFKDTFQEPSSVLLLREACVMRALGMSIQIKAVEESAESFFLK